MKTYKKVIKRLTTQDCPLSFGSIAINFIENKKGKPFSELIDGVLSVSSLEDIQTKNDILSLKYLINVEITSSPSEEDLQDIRVGFKNLDKASIDYRVNLATNDTDKYKESARRTTANLHVNGLFDVGTFINEFDLCNLDLGLVSIEDLKNNRIPIMEVMQRPNPTTYIIPVELANEMNDPKFKEDPLVKMFTPVNKVKSVFTYKKELTNPFVRTL